MYFRTGVVGDWPLLKALNVPSPSISSTAEHHGPQHHIRDPSVFSGGHVRKITVLFPDVLVLLCRILLSDIAGSVVMQIMRLSKWIYAV